MPAEAGADYPCTATGYETSVQGYVRQASGKSIAFGSVNAQFDGDQVCDGSPHVLVLDVAADPAGVPFKSGSAVVAASGYGDWTSQNWETGESGRNRGYASTGWVATKLAK